MLTDDIIRLYKKGCNIDEIIYFTKSMIKINRLVDKMNNNNE